MAAASRSNGTQRGPCAHYVRFTESQNQSLHRVARFKGKTIQAYLHEAAMEAIARDLRSLDEEDARKAKARGRAGETSKPIGLGIRERLEESRTTPVSFRTRRLNAPPDPEPPSEAQQPSIVIQNTTSPSTLPETADVERLANYVVAGAQWDRELRLQQAVKIIEATTRTPDDRRRLAQLLDDRVTALSGKRESSFTSMIMKFLSGGDHG